MATGQSASYNTGEGKHYIKVQPTKYFSHLLLFLSIKRQNDSIWLP